MIVPSAEIKVHSIEHLNSLLKRGHHNYKMESRVWPSGELRNMTLYVEKPPEGARDPWLDDFGHYACSLALRDPSAYESTIYCLGHWNAHEIAEETATWG